MSFTNSRSTLIPPKPSISFVETLSGHIGVEHHLLQIKGLKLTIDTSAVDSDGGMAATVDSGLLYCSDLLGEDLAVIEGSFQLFSCCMRSPAGMNYDVRLRGIKSGDIYELRAEKHLAPRRVALWRLLDIWPDTTTINLRLWRLYASETTRRQLLGTGLLRITMPAFLRQLTTLRTNPQLPRLTRMIVLGQFLKFFCKNLWQIYVKPVDKVSDPIQVPERS